MNNEYLEMSLIEARGGHTRHLKRTSNPFVGHLTQTTNITIRVMPECLET
jgi:hypothetical protein